MSTPQNMALLHAAYEGNLAQARAAVEDGADFEYMEPQTRLTALHIAVGRDHLELVKYLLEEVGAQLRPDGFGRWPSVIAAQCRTSDEVSDLVVGIETAIELERDRDPQ